MNQESNTNCVGRSPNDESDASEGGAGRKYSGDMQAIWGAACRYVGHHEGIARAQWGIRRALQDTVRHCRTLYGAVNYYEGTVRHCEECTAKVQLAVPSQCIHSAFAVPS